MPTVLLITYHFPPSAASGAFRLLGFTQQLPAHGWKCAVIAPPQLPWEPVDPSLEKRVPPETIRCPVPYPSGLPKVLRWMAQYSIWLPYARSAARRLVQEIRPDAVLTSGPPHGVHLIGRYLQKHHALPWIADFRDPWITSAFTIFSTPLIQRFELYWEGRVMKTADLILANAPRACEVLKNAYPDCALRMTYLTNGYDPMSFPDVEEPQTRERIGPIRILHAGELYVGRDPRPLLDALAGIPAGTTPPIVFEFLGRTDYAAGADLKADAKQRGVEDNVHCRGQVKYDQVLMEMCQADILLLMDTPGRKIGVPAKLYEYFGAGRPILATGEPDGDLAAILAESGVPHRIVPPNDPVKIRQGLVELVNGLTTGQLGKISSEQRLRFSRATLAGKLSEMLNELVQKKNRSASKR